MIDPNPQSIPAPVPGPAAREAAASSPWRPPEWLPAWLGQATPLVFTSTLLLVVLLGSARVDGGVTASAWGAATLSLALIGLAGLLSHPVRLGRLEIIALGAFPLLLVWTALSLMWTSSLSLSTLEVERALIPVAALAATLIAAQRRSAAAPLVAVFAATLSFAVWGLVGGVDPPLGYANALAVACVAGMLLTVGWACAHGGIAVAAAAPVVGLFGVIVLRSDSRAAWIALLGGVAVGLALRSPRRPLLLAFAALGASIVAVTTLALLVSAPRVEYWAASLRGIRDSPITGSGAGTWSQVWLTERNAEFTAHNAHNLYLEALSDLGPVGLALLGAALVAPLVGAARARRERYVPAAAGAYSALVIHMAVDWDWQITGFLLIVVLLGGFLLRAAGRADAESERVLSRTAGVLALTVISLAAAVVWAGGHFNARAALDLRTAQWSAAADDANRARLLMPFASEPLRVRGDALLALGDLEGASRSYQRAIELDPNNAELWRALAMVLPSAERRQACETIARLDPLASARPCPRT